MKIEHFERDSQDRIVAVGDKSIVLSYEFVAQHKPTIGDEVFETEEGIFFGKQIVVEPVPEVITTDVVEPIPAVNVEPNFVITEPIV